MPTTMNNMGPQKMMHPQQGNMVPNRPMQYRMPSNPIYNQSQRFPSKICRFIVTEKL